MDKENREVPEVRNNEAQVEEKDKTLIGMAIVYNEQSQPLRNGSREFREVIVPGAFDESLATGKSSIENRPITFVFRHDDYSEYGDTATNLKLFNEARGVRFELDIPEYAKHLKEAIKEKRITGMSFEMYVIKDRWEGNVRYIEKADLTHIAAVPKGAYSSAKVEIRDINYHQWKIQLLRKYLS